MQDFHLRERVLRKRKVLYNKRIAVDLKFMLNLVKREQFKPAVKKQLTMFSTSKKVFWGANCCIVSTQIHHEMEIQQKGQSYRTKGA